MNNKIHDAFDPIRATEGLKQNLNTFIHSEVIKRKHKTHTPLRNAFACCGMFVIMVCGIGGYHFYQAPVSYISVDINPSIELTLNRFDRVIESTAYSDDGAELLTNLNLDHKPYTKAVELLLSDKTFESYLSEDSFLSFTIVSDKEEALLAGIQQCQGYAENKATCHSANSDNMEAAHHSGLSVGKYQAYLELSQYDKTITPEDCKNLSMRQIRDLINQYITGDSGANNNGGCGWGNNNGNENGHHGRRN